MFNFIKQANQRKIKLLYIFNNSLTVSIKTIKKKGNYISIKQKKTPVTYNFFDKTDFVTIYNTSTRKEIWTIYNN